MEIKKEVIAKGKGKSPIALNVIKWSHMGYLLGNACRPPLPNYSDNIGKSAVHMA